METLRNIPKEYLFILNQVFDMEQKVSALKESNTLQRNLDKLKKYFKNSVFEGDIELEYHNPIGEKYSETRTDCEASIAGDSTKNLRIVEVIKPIIRLRKGATTQIVQKAVVVVESRKNWKFFLSD